MSRREGEGAKSSVLCRGIRAKHFRQWFCNFMCIVSRAGCRGDGDASLVVARAGAMAKEGWVSQSLERKASGPRGMLTTSCLECSALMCSRADSASGTAMSVTISYYDCSTPTVDSITLPMTLETRFREVSFIKAVSHVLQASIVRSSWWHLKPRGLS